MKVLGLKLKNKAFCVIPWLHLHVMPDSSVIPCCVSPYNDHYGSVATTDIHEIWNNEKYRELRLKMLNGEIPKGCNHCHSVEASGFSSMRNKLNKWYEKDIPTFLNNTEKDGSYYEVKLKYIDIRFSNLCNLKCRGCSPALSSSWYDDYAQLFNVKPTGPKVKSISADAPGFWKTFNELVLDAEDIYFGGGEPLISKEHFDVLRLLIAKGKTDVHISYNTNLSTLTYGNHNLVDLWSKFKSVSLGISIDDLGPRAEYFRSGSKWSVVEKNLLNLRDNYKNIYRHINCTVNITNIFYLPEIYTYLHTEKIMSPDFFNINMLLDPDEYRIDIIPYEAKLKIKAKIEKFIPYLEKNNLLKVKKDFLHAVDHMMKEDRSDLFPSFIETTKKLDKIRNESFVDTYPELASILGMIPEATKPAELIPVKLNVQEIVDPFEKQNYSLAIFNHDFFFDGETADHNLNVRTLPSLQNLKYKLLKENEWDDFLAEMIEAKKSVCIVMASGIYISDHESFITNMIIECEDMLQKGWPAVAHIMNFETSHLLPYFHEQMFMINLKVWDEMGRPKLGPLFSNTKETLTEAHISEETLHGTFTPTFIGPKGKTTRQGELALGSLLTVKAVEAGLGIKGILPSLWFSFKYAYPRDKNQNEKNEIDQLIDDKKMLEIPDNHAFDHLNLHNFLPRKLITSFKKGDVRGLLKKFSSIEEIIFLVESELELKIIENEMKFERDLTNKALSFLITKIEDVCMNVSFQLSENEKFIIWVQDDQMSKLHPINLIAEKTRYRIYKHNDSNNFILGKGLDFIRGVVLDGTLDELTVSKGHWSEIKPA
jgi:MoaA/NifB/PqqE/SkfB family radical SAM enzyme